ncbi:MAG: DUF2089 family protein [Candidatus Sumerlaeia bacterium]
MPENPEIPAWMRSLSEEEWHFVRRFILASGSLKDLAQQYGISYPTVRVRLDRLIEKIQIAEDAKNKTPFHATVRLMVADGTLDISVARSLIRAFERFQKGEDK